MPRRPDPGGAWAVTPVGALGVGVTAAIAVLASTCAPRLAPPPSLGGAGSTLDVVSPAPGALVPRNLERFEVAWRTDASGPWTVTLRGQRGSLRREAAGLEHAVSQHDVSALGVGPVELRVCPVASASPPCGIASFTVVDEALPDAVLYRTVGHRFDAAADSLIRRFASGPAPVVQSRGRCVGCHAYTRGRAALKVREGRDRRLFVFDTAGDEPRLADARRIGEFSFMAWAPDGRHLVLVVDAQGALQAHDREHAPFDLTYRSGDLAVYDAVEKSLQLLDGASEVGLVEDMPSFCRDGAVLFIGYTPARMAGSDEAGAMGLRSGGRADCRRPAPRARRARCDRRGRRGCRRRSPWTRRRARR